MRLSDTVATARLDFARAVAPVLDRPLTDVLSVMDRELTALKHHQQSASDVRWYTSLERGEPDYGIYDDADYMLYLWPGTVLYARPTLRWTVQHVPQSAVETVIDLGCGIGITTALLADAYPHANVYGTNLEGIQARVARRLSDEHDFTLVPDITHITADPDTTLVVASEYFEHFHDPITHLTDNLTHLTPQHFAIANAFGARSAGHFPTYQHHGDTLTPRQAGRRFNNTLRAHGYTNTGSGWNGRPTLWTRILTP